MIDNPRVRADYTCPLCLDPKDAGLLVCWPCHREQTMTNHGTYSPEAEKLITCRDKYLAGDLPAWWRALR